MIRENKANELVLVSTGECLIVLYTELSINRTVSPVSFDPVLAEVFPCFTASFISLSNRSLHSRKISLVTGVPWNLA